jgi:uncharacterized phage infection (PIP) family protein YhgE
MKKKVSYRKNKPTACFGVDNGPIQQGNVPTQGPTGLAPTPPINGGGDGTGPITALSLPQQPSSSSGPSGNGDKKCINCTENLSKTIEGLTEQVTESAKVLNKLDAYEQRLKEALRDKIQKLQEQWSKLTPDQQKQRLDAIRTTQAKCEECEKACAEQMEKLQQQTKKLKDAMKDLGDRFEDKEHVKEFVADVTRGFEKVDNKEKMNMGRVVASAFGISNSKKYKRSKGSKKSKK